MAKTKVRIYHNPRCTKSREALALLEAQGIEPEVVEYLKTAPSVEELKALLKMLGGAPHALLRSKEEPYKQLKLGKDATLEQVASAIAAHPILLERPVVVVGKKAVIGRPPEKVLELL